MLKVSTNGGKPTMYNPLPNVILGLRMGNNQQNCIQEYNPEIRVDDFKKSFQLLLSTLSIQTGFSSNFLSFDTETGTVTATQVNKEDRQTVNMISNIQTSWKQTIRQLIEVLDTFLELYDYGNKQKFTIQLSSTDFSIDATQDMLNDLQLVKEKIIPKWKYLVTWYGYSEEDAKKVVQEAEGTDV